MTDIIGRIEYRLLNFALNHGIAGNIVLGVAAMLFFTILFSWQFSLFLMVFIFVHEEGHVLAIKRCGGEAVFFFVPLIGGATLLARRIRTWREDIFITGSGPMLSAVLGIGLTVAWLTLDMPFCGVCAVITAVMNNINLLPIPGADGRRIFNALDPQAGTRVEIIAWVSAAAALIGVAYFSRFIGAAVLLWLAKSVYCDRSLLHGQNPEAKKSLDFRERMAVLGAYAGVLVLQAIFIVIACNALGSGFLELIG